MIIHRAPRRIVGMQALADFLALVGIEVRRAWVMSYQRLGFPVQWRGKRAKRRARPFFTSYDIDRWVELATGYRLREWQERRSRCPAPPVVVVGRQELRCAASREGPIWVGLKKWGDTEQIAIREDGLPYAVVGVSGHKLAAKWPVANRETWMDCVSRFSASRRAAKEDFGRGSPSMVEAVIAPRLFRDGDRKFVRVRGTLFGLDPAVSCPLVAPSSWPKWTQVVDAVDRKYPDAVWTLWEQREDYDRITLVPVVSGSQEIADSVF